MSLLSMRNGFILPPQQHHTTTATDDRRDSNTTSTTTDDAFSHRASISTDDDSPRSWDGEISPPPGTTTTTAPPVGAPSQSVVEYTPTAAAKPFTFGLIAAHHHHQLSQQLHHHQLQPQQSHVFDLDPSSSMDAVIPKIEEVDEVDVSQHTASTTNSSLTTQQPPGAPVHVPRKRGRPRKHPLPVPGGQVKITKGRSKTGCVTCRRRKKKCDETKPA